MVAVGSLGPAASRVHRQSFEAVPEAFAFASWIQHRSQNFPADRGTPGHNSVDLVRLASCQKVRRRCLPLDNIQRYPCLFELPWEDLESVAAGAGAAAVAVAAGVLGRPVVEPVAC